MSGDLRIKCEMMNGDLRRIRIYTNGDLRYNLDFFFLQLQQLTGVRLYEKESVIIFDEVQLLPKARQAIKYLVADGRYKYIETGSLLSIKKNTKDILIPSEEHKISMYPMDFEEFLWAVGDEITADTIKLLLKSKKICRKCNAQESDAYVSVVYADWRNATGCRSIFRTQ